MVPNQIGPQWNVQAKQKGEIGYECNDAVERGEGVEGPPPQHQQQPRTRPPWPREHHSPRLLLLGIGPIGRIKSNQDKARECVARRACDWESRAGSNRIEFVAAADWLGLGNCVAEVRGDETDGLNPRARCRGPGVWVLERWWPSIGGCVDVVIRFTATVRGVWHSYNRHFASDQATGYCDTSASRSSLARASENDHASHERCLGIPLACLNSQQSGSTHGTRVMEWTEKRQESGGQ
nr:unnamed protein product [Digitaria exilis]